ncbi:hypothetical protein IPF89_00915 [Candidatus Saccharibacteria bacterium]|nr:MAG: hypothetical protein IPF89_00915 [Candidatus Saccharibacteria bacterium]
MFSNTTAFNQDISTWNMSSNVTYYDAHALIPPIL